jgi:hypothetical protein
MLPENSRTLTSLKKLALVHPSVEEGIACAGTSLEALTFNVRKKAFLFIAGRDDLIELRFKLDQSMKAAQKLAAKNTDGMQVGKNGWTKLTFPSKSPPAGNLLKRWIGESYALFAPRKPG